MKKDDLYNTIFSEILIIMGSGALGAILSRTTISAFWGILLAILTIILGMLFRLKILK
jgi:hypothetical protein